jgi:putative phosphoribosyl transferase
MNSELIFENHTMNLPVTIPIGRRSLEGDLALPPNPLGIVLFAHGSGSSRKSVRNKYVAGILNGVGVGTLLFDLLRSEEELLDGATRALRFDIGLLATRLAEATRWLKEQPEAQGLDVGYFGASTGGAAALAAAADLGDQIAAVVSRGGRPDLAGGALGRVKCPTLLIVGGQDPMVIHLNQEAYTKLRCEKALHIVPGATHLFEETGKLEQVAQASAQWFKNHMGGRK